MLNSALGDFDHSDRSNIEGQSDPGCISICSYIHIYLYIIYLHLYLGDFDHGDHSNIEGLACLGTLSCLHLYLRHNLHSLRG